MLNRTHAMVKLDMDLIIKQIYLSGNTTNLTQPSASWPVQDKKLNEPLRSREPNCCSPAAVPMEFPRTPLHAEPHCWELLPLLQPAQPLICVCCAGCSSGRSSQQCGSACSGLNTYQWIHYRPSHTAGNSCHCCSLHNKHISVNPLQAEPHCWELLPLLQPAQQTHISESTTG